MNREDLKSYKYTQEWIKGRIEYIESYKSIVNRLTSTVSDMPKGSRQIQDAEAEKMAMLMDMVDKLLDKVLEEGKKQKKILEQLDKVEQPCKIILDKVYIQGKTLVTVASELGYSYNRIKHLHGIALNKFDDICREDKNERFKNIYI